MKKILYYITAVLLLLVATMACSEHQDLADNSGTSTTPIGKVNFTVSTSSQSAAAAARRASIDDTAPATKAAYEREFQVTDLYAVLFRPDQNNLLKAGEWVKTVSVTATPTSAGANTYDCSFDAGMIGVYFMYLVANPSTALADMITGVDAINGLKSGSTLDDFFGLQETVVPNDNTADHFLMVSDRVRLDIDGKNDPGPGLDVGDIHIQRAAVRIDIDASSVTGFVIDRVTINRIEQTELAHRAVTDESGLGGRIDKTYTAPTTKNIIDNSDPSNPVYDVTDQWWKGVIYAYENPFNVDPGSSDADAVEAGATVVTISGTKDGEVLVAQVVFNAIPLKRNTLYDIVLNYSTAEYGKLKYNILVKDWNEENLKFDGDNLVNPDLPRFFVVGASRMTAPRRAITSVKTQGDQLDPITGKYVNPTVIYVPDGETTLTIEVHTVASAAGAKIPVDKGDLTATGTMTVDDATGDLVQQFTFKVKAASEIGYDEIPLYVSNQLDGRNVTSYISHGMKLKASLAEADKIQAYTGSDITPNVDVRDYFTNDPLTKGTHYTVSYVNNRNRGTATVRVQGIGDYLGTFEDTFEITHGAGTISFGAASQNIIIGTPQTFAVTNTGDGVVTYESSDASIATVNNNGYVTGLKEGTVTITAHVNDGTNYKYANKEAEYTLNISKKSGQIYFDGITSVVHSTGPTDYRTYTVTNTGDGTVTYSSSNESIVTVNATTGQILGHTEGTATITATVTDGTVYKYAIKTAEYSVTVKRKEIGWFLNSDGSLTMDKLSTSYAVVVYMGAIPGYCDEFLALGVEDCSASKVNWNNALTAVNTWASSHPITINSTVYNSNSTGSVAYDVVTNNQSTSSKTSTSVRKGWRLPSVTDWRYIFNFFGGPDPTSPAGVKSAANGAFDGPAMVTAINNACGEGASALKKAWYWSSSEENASNAWEMHLDHTHWYKYPKKNVDCYPRAIFAY